MLAASMYYVLCCHLLYNFLTTCPYRESRTNQTSCAEETITSFIYLYKIPLSSTVRHGKSFTHPPLKEWKLFATPPPSLWFKDRQHRSRGGFAFSFIVQELSEVEYCTIYQMKATIFLYPFILNNKLVRVY